MTSNPDDWRFYNKQRNGQTRFVAQGLVPLPSVIRRGVYFAFLLALNPACAEACGWWGDGETSRTDITLLPTHDGKPLPEALTVDNTKLPGRMGYGIAVTEQGRAIPYLQATYGRPLARIRELKAFGFQTVIDLGTPEKTARLHRAETEAVGMRYHNIPIAGHNPNADQTKLFSSIVLNATVGSLLVYAPSSSLLGMMWASHRLNVGSPMDFAIAEGMALGLTQEQAATLRTRATGTMGSAD